MTKKKGKKMSEYGGLLDAVNQIVKGNRARRPYNIFQVLEVDDREVPMCRFLADILNPRGMHGKGSYYLYSFLRDVLQREDAEAICGEARVYKEFPISGERRIDIVIVTEDVFIPVEVKLYAGDQRAQCYDYLIYARKRDPKARVVYLTLHGNAPGACSRENYDRTVILCESDFLCISFAEEILGWLDRLVAEETDPMMREVLSQYAKSLQNLTFVSEKEAQMELVEEVLKSEENFRGMLALSEIEKKAKARLLYTVLEELERGLTEVSAQFHLGRENEICWYEYRDQANESYYRQSESTYPGINYVFRDVPLPGGVQLWLRVEIDYALFFGVCLFDPSAENGDGDQVDHPAGELWRALLPYAHIPQEPPDSWWVKWWYLPTGTDQRNAERELVPDFKSLNGAAICLADSEKRERFVEKCVAVIRRTLEEFLK